MTFLEFSLCFTVLTHFPLVLHQAGGFWPGGGGGASRRMFIPSVRRLTSFSTKTLKNTHFITVAPVKCGLGSQCKRWMLMFQPQELHIKSACQKKRGGEKEGAGEGL